MLIVLGLFILALGVIVSVGERIPIRFGPVLPATFCGPWEALGVLLPNRHIAYFERRFISDSLALQPPIDYLRIIESRKLLMTDQQLYLSIGIPTFAVLIGILLNGFLYNALNSRIASLEARMLSLETTVTARFDLMMGKLMELDTRLSVLEDRFKR